MLNLIAIWFVSAFALWAVAQLVPGVEVKGLGPALLATVLIAIVNVTLGPVLKFLLFPVTILTLGLFSLVINATLLKLVSIFTPGFRIRGFLPALVGSVALTILTAVLRALLLNHGPVERWF